MTFNYEGCSTAPLMDFANNPIYQVLRTEKGYFKNSSKRAVYIDLRESKGYTGDLERLRRYDSEFNLYDSLKSAAAKQMKMRV